MADLGLVQPRVLREDLRDDLEALRELERRVLLEARDLQPTTEKHD